MESNFQQLYIGVLTCDFWLHFQEMHSKEGKSRFHIVWNYQSTKVVGLEAAHTDWQLLLTLRLNKTTASAANFQSLTLSYITSFDVYIRNFRFVHFPVSAAESFFADSSAVCLCYSRHSLSCFVSIWLNKLWTFTSLSLLLCLLERVKMCIFIPLIVRVLK